MEPPVFSKSCGVPFRNAADCAPPSVAGPWIAPLVPNIALTDGNNVIYGRNPAPLARPNGVELRSFGVELRNPGAAVRTATPLVRTNAPLLRKNDAPTFP
jgi:hypothetical protein